MATSRDTAGQHPKPVSVFTLQLQQRKQQAAACKPLNEPENGGGIIGTHDASHLGDESICTSVASTAVTVGGSEIGRETRTADMSMITEVTPQPSIGAASPMPLASVPPVLPPTHVASPTAVSPTSPIPHAHHKQKEKEKHAHEKEKEQERYDWSVKSTIEMMANTRPRNSAQVSFEQERERDETGAIVVAGLPERTREREREVGVSVGAPMVIVSKPREQEKTENNEGNGKQSLLKPPSDSSSDQVRPFISYSFS